MIILIDLKKYNTKSSLLEKLSQLIPDMFGRNYDALIDSASYYDKPLKIELENLDCYEDKQNLIEVFDIISCENANFSYLIKNN